ncbi:MAG TPA: DNRLRE domain-containing protein [Rariglobus sp.]|nr:DNRLRE domain-containing protein [Rariglobus sp.]
MHTKCLIESRLLRGLTLLFASAILAQAATLSPTADAFVRSGTYASLNYGAATTLSLKLTTPGDDWNRDAYLSFDLSGITAPIATAKLRLYGGSGVSGASASVYGLAAPTTSWTEGTGGNNGATVTGITWNNKPAASSTAQASTILSAANAWNEWTLTNYLVAEKAAGRNLVTLVVKANGDIGSSIISLNSRTAASNPPLLVLGSWISANQDDPQITYAGPWTYNFDGFNQSSTASSTAEFTFTGTGVRYYAKKASYLNDQIEITIDGVVQTPTVSTNTAIQNNEALLYENTALSNATHSIRVRRTSGQWITVSKFEYLSDGTAPSGVAITAPAATPAASGYILPDAMVTVTANATNATSVKLQLDGADIPGVASDSTAPYSFTWDASLVPAGPHTLRVVATNAAGSMTAPAIPVLIELFAGVNTHVGQGQNATNLLNLAVESGANLVRDGVGWSIMETTQGTYNWTNSWGSNVESFITQANGSGIRGMWGLVGENQFYTSPWIDNTTVGRVGYANFGKAVSQRFSTNNNLRIIAIQNEPTGNYCGVDQDGDGSMYDDNTAARYYEIIKAAYPKIKEGNPQAIVTGPVTMLAKWFDLNFITALQQAGGATYIDWLDLHTYNPVAQNDPARRLESMTRWLKDSVQPLFPTKPILVSEYGYSSPDGDPVCTQLKKAEELARTYLSVRTVPNIRGLVWYQLNDDYNRHGLCLKSTEGYARQEAFYTFQDIAPIFRRAAYYGRGTIATNVWLIKFKDTTGDLYAAWCEEDGAPNLAFSFTASAAGDLQVREVKTTPTAPANITYAFTTGGNTVNIPLTTRVKFIRVPAGVTLTPNTSYGFSATPIP